MNLVSNDELVQRAGVDPWALHQKLAVGDPAQIESLAAAFYKAGGDMSTFNADQQKAQTYVKQGYTVAGASPVDFDAQTKATATSPEHLQQIGKILDAVGTDLDTAATSAATSVTELETTLTSIDAQWTQFWQGIGHHLPESDSEPTRQGYISDAVQAVKTHGTAINTLVTTYEETIYGAQKSMSDLGYVPPAQLDDLYGDGAEYIKQLQALAKKEADKIKNNNTLDGKWATGLHTVAGEVAPYLNDPYFASAFYGELGPQETQLLPQLMYASGSKTAGADLKTFSHLFGVAVTNAGDDPGMAAVKDVFLNTPPEAQTSWDRAAMVSNGSFPPDWLAQAARANALDVLAKNGSDGFNHMGFQGTPNGSFPYDVGVSGNVVAAWTQDLGNNPTAAREALATMGQPGSDVTITGDPTAAYQRNIHTLIEYGKQEGYPGDVAKGYGAAFEAASGADNETDGAHSGQATDFTKALFNDVAHDSGDVQPNAAGNFAKIGASYVQEMAAGNTLTGDSVGGLPVTGQITGDNAAFGVPPDAAKSFMKTFVGDAGATKTFDTAAGLAAHHAMLAGAQLDTQLLGQHKAAFALSGASQAYGSVAGSENGAALQVVGQQVEDTEHANEIMKGVLSAGIDMLPAGKLAEDAGGALAKVSDSVWDAMKHTSNMGLEHAYSAPSGSQQQLTQLQDANYDVAMVGDYERTAILHEAGYPGTAGLPPDLIGHDGQMLNVATVMSDEQLKTEYYNYMNTTAHDPEGTLGQGASVYELTKDAAGRYSTAYGQSRGDTEGKSGE